MASRHHALHGLHDARPEVIEHAERGTHHRFVVKTIGNPDPGLDIVITMEYKRLFRETTT